ncbi:MAG TPA: glutamine--fructose-6-phosphate transaminase (isomerizing), partial [Gammaproteobacteria bacterium]
MCGIVGAVAARKVAFLLLEGLQRLEYRGYDSSGIATCASDGRLHRLRAVGSVGALASALSRSILPGDTGIAHTRWATHGIPSELNAHPHLSGGRVAVVHNGIIENAARLRAELDAAGYHFESQTDTEVIAHLVHRQLVLQGNGDLRDAVRTAAARLRGQFAIAVLGVDHPDRLVVARQGCPLIVGFGDGENFIASDAAALLPLTRRMLYLEEGDFAEVTRHAVEVFDAAGRPVERAMHEHRGSAESADRGAFRHFMQKEIFEQPAAIARTLGRRIDDGGIAAAAFDARTQRMLREARAVHIVACGTSYHAALTARYLIERFARVPCIAEQASEYRYRSPVVLPGTLL